jgi:hypothetical protein
MIDSNSDPLKFPNHIWWYVFTYVAWKIVPRSRLEPVLVTIILKKN